MNQHLICDGQVLATAPAAGALSMNDEPMLIGAESDQGEPSRFFTGELAEAALWCAVLGESELATIMSRGAPSASP